MPAVLGIALAFTGALAVAALHVLPPTSRVSPVHRTISEYALHETGWLFNFGVFALALGSLAVLIALHRTGLTRLASLGGAGVLLWCVGLTGVVVFPKHNWAAGPSLSGDLHRVASLVAFVALPVGAFAIAWAWRAERPRRHCAMWTVGTAALAALCFGIILGAILLEPVTGVRWWRAIPLGAVERGLATAEVATVFALGWWAAKPRTPRVPLD